MPACLTSVSHQSGFTCPSTPPTYEGPCQDLKDEVIYEGEEEKLNRL